MNIEIDQSGKIEQTNLDTVIAFSNSRSFSVKIKARTKRRLLEEFRLRGQSKLFTLRTFTAGVCILIKDHLSVIDRVAIDIEYVGKDDIVKDVLLEMIKKSSDKISKNFEIKFKRVGKHSDAHILALSVLRKKAKASRIVQYSELTELAIKKSR